MWTFMCASISLVPQLVQKVGDAEEEGPGDFQRG